MPTELKCVGCGAVYPLAAVQHRDRFACTQCARPILVPIAGPSAARARGAAPPALREEPPPLPAQPPPSTPRVPPRRRPAPIVAPQRDVPSAARRPLGTMKPLRGLSYAVMATLGFALLVQFAMVAGHLDVVDFAKEIASGAEPDVDRGAAIRERADLLSQWVTLAAAAAAIPFLIWFHRAHGNLSEAGLGRLEYSPAWAVGGFFVPLLNLVRPFQVMTEVSKGTSFLAGVARVSKWRNARASPLVGWWWGLLTGSGMAILVSFLVLIGGDSASRFVVIGWIGVAASLMRAGAAVVVATLVHRISVLQDRAAAASDEPA